MVKNLSIKNLSVRAQFAIISAITIPCSLFFYLVADRRSLIWHTSSADFRIYFRAIEWWMRGNDLYTFKKPPGMYGFTYPPFAAIFLSPVTIIPEDMAVHLMYGVNVLILACVIWYAAKPLSRLLKFDLTLLTLGLTFVAISLDPVRFTMGFGQINICIMAAIIVDVCYLIPRKSKYAGTLIGLTIAIKLTPAVFVVYLLFIKKYRPAIIASSIFVAANILSVAISYKVTWKYWSKSLWDTSRVAPNGLDHFINQSLSGMISRIFDLEKPPSWAWGLAIVATVVLLFPVARAFNHQKEHLLEACTIGLLVCLVSPVSWIHHMVWVVPIMIVLVYKYLSVQSQISAAILTVMFIGFTTSMMTLAHDRRWGHHFPQSIHLIANNLYTLLALLLAGMLFVLARKQKPKDDPLSKDKNRVSITAEDDEKSVSAA